MRTESNSALQRVGALLLIAAGIFFLATNVFGFRFDFWGTMWPFAVIVPGVVLLILAFTGDKGMAGLAYPGMVVTGTGAILLYQNITNHWESWAYLWALYPGFVGLAMMFQGTRTGSDKEVASGRSLVTGSLIGTLVFGVFFELLIFRSGGALANILLPVILIAIGGYLLLRRSPVGLNGDKRKHIDPAQINPELKRKIDEALTE